MARLVDLSEAARQDLASMMELHFNALTVRLALLEGEAVYDDAAASLRAFGEHLQDLFNPKPASRRGRRRHDGEEGAEDKNRESG